ncbi:MAG: glycosyltransferase, partial [Candidatus Nanoarchaeia archaeon]|nr:glycosyltransferase [Candidatus Nanoarchaeia archaeon]
KPVILSKAENTEKLFNDGEAGYFVEPNDINALTNAMLKISKDKIRYKKMSSNARKLVEEKYNWNEIVKKSISGLI